jgi:hypothetical protein
MENNTANNKMKKKSIIFAIIAILFVGFSSFKLINHIYATPQQEMSSTNCEDDEKIIDQKRVHAYYCDTPSIVIDVYYCPSSGRFYANMTSPERRDRMTISRMRGGSGNAYVSYKGCDTYFFYINDSRW